MYYSQYEVLGHVVAHHWWDFWVTQEPAGQTILVKYASFNSCFQYEQFDVLRLRSNFGSFGVFGSLRGQGVKIFGSNDT